MTTDQARQVAEQLADVLEERGLVVAPAAPPRVLTVAQVAEQLGLSTDWVYEHARELRAFRMGAGERARLGFDQQQLDAWKRRQALAPPPAEPTAARRRRGRQAPAPDLIAYED